MKYHLLRFVIISSVAGCLTRIGYAAAPVRGQTIGCAADDRYVPLLERYFKELAEDTTAIGRETRDTLRIPAGPSAAVEVVHADSICGAAAVALDSALAVGSAPVSRVSVFRVAVDRYFVWDRTPRNRRFEMGYVFDSTFSQPLARRVF